MLNHFIFTINYKIDKSKRNHTHRCKACNKIIEDNSNVVMLRKGINKTWVIHDECKDSLCDNDNTWLDYFNSWAVESLLKISSVEYVRKNHSDEYNVYLKLNNIKG